MVLEIYCYQVFVSQIWPNIYKILIETITNFVFIISNFSIDKKSWAGIRSFLLIDNFF